MTSRSTGGGGAHRLWWLILGLGAFGLILDQSAKAIALSTLDPQQPVPLLGGLITLQLIRNPGAAFSMGEDLTVVLTLVAIGALLGVLFWLLPRVRHLGWAVAVGFLLAGISGNLADRLFREPGPFRGHVIDFIQLPHFAIFNVADMFITGAAILVIWMSLITQVTPSGVRGKAPEPGTDG
ncbi:MAG: signal peptidase II [Propionicimonas sp.]